MVRTVSEARWQIVTNNAKNVANEINTTSKNIEMPRTTKEYFTQIEELAEALNQLTRTYIATTLTDLNKMQEAAARAIERDAAAARDIQNQPFIGSPMGDVAEAQ